MTSSLPCIDLKAHSSLVSLSAELATVCSGPGFFYLKNHGIPESVSENAFSLSEKYFIGAGDEEKVNGNGDIGYTAVAESLDSSMPGKGDLKESFYYADPRGMKNETQYLPPTLKEASTTLESLVAACNEVASRLLQALAMALGLAENTLIDEHGGQPDIRAGAHTDYGSLTLLFQHRVSGLQVRRKSKWIDVAPVPGCIVVNIGDALEFWSGGLFKSTVHRVVMPRTLNEAASRYSIAYFVQPNSTTQLRVLSNDSNINEQAFDDIIESKGLPRGTRDITGGAYLKTRIAATYGVLHQQLTA